jgi:hypothetical protein
MWWFVAMLLVFVLQVLYVAFLVVILILKKITLVPFGWLAAVESVYWSYSYSRRLCLRVFVEM